MKRGSRFTVGLATAGLTFGALFLTLGQSQFNKYGYRHHGCHGYYMHHCEEPVENNTQK